MTIGQRLRAMAEDKWGKRGALTKLAEVLEIKLPNLYIYLNDDSKPGADILKKLIEYDFDLVLLLTGNEAKTTAEMINEPIKYLNQLEREKNIYWKRLQELEKENIQLKKKLAVFEKASKYFNEAKEIDP